MNSIVSSTLGLRRPSILALALLLALSVAAPAQATFPGKPGPIVYPKALSSETQSSGGLLAHGPGRRSPVRQLTHGGADNTPSFSADGRRIVFSSDQDPGSGASSHIYVMNADGSGISALTSGEVFDSNPTFSPDGREVVFNRTLGRGHPHLFAVDSGGGGLRQLTAGPFDDYEPVFAPNGRWIAFTSNRDHDVRTDRSDIFSMRPDGSRMRVLIDGPRNESEPDISPDGHQIVFTSNRDHGPNVFVAAVSGRHLRELTHARVSCFRADCYLSPVWAPDGRHIAVVRAGRYSSSLEVMGSDGSGATEFASAGSEEEGFGSFIGPPTWGPLPK